MILRDYICMAVSNENGGAFPAWMFPAPARKSRFIAAKPEWAGLNIEVALGKIHPYEFAPRGESNVLRFDIEVSPFGFSRNEA